jgi:cysteinyl-tRNA synthetase
MYVCGVTVYDLSHIGHARSAIVFDVIRRYLVFRGYRVTFVKNFTDVDDKIIRRAQQEGVPSREISERYIGEFARDMAAVGVLPPDIEPKATEHVPQMIALIERLVAKGVAYVVDGDVYFQIARFPEYGKLSGKNLDELLAGARVDVDERKRDPRDFALWKAAKPGEPAWPSPWGSGRPGWHIECSAMSMHYLGPSFDLHGGGEDLIFPHHECEIAQSEAATGMPPFARGWVHNGFVNLGAEKMSKSLGNTLLIREVVKRHDAEALRLWLLGTHYRHPVDFSEERLQEAGRALDRLRGLVDEAQRLSPSGIGGWYGGGLAAGATNAWLAEIGDRELMSLALPCVDRFLEAMDDDFNTPGALAALFDLGRELNRYRDAGPLAGARHTAFANGVRLLARLGQALGLFQAPASAMPPDLAALVQPLVAEREEARKQRNFKHADELRQKIAALGATVEDTPAGPKVKWSGR